MNHSTRNCIHLLVVAAVIMLVAANPVLTFAMPRDPIDPDPVGIPEEVIAPDNGFEWAVPDRFGPYTHNDMWIEDPPRYVSTYVHPTSFPVYFDGCRTAADEENGTSAMTYTWVINGQTMTAYYHTCRFLHTFASQGTYPVSLTITKTDGNVLLDEQGRGNPFQQNIVVRDILIVSLGDSYASGEGNPDRAQVLGGADPWDPFNIPLEVVEPVEWQDSRCHRSAKAAPAKAAMLIEWADPHTSVTFLSFACSGATINTPTYKDASPFDPYRNPVTSGWTQLNGSGILGEYAGKEPPDPDNPQNNRLPSQIDQLMTALTNGGEVPARPVDALLITGGGNDIHFGDIAAMCVIYQNCQNLPVTAPDFNSLQPLQARVQADIDALPGRYLALANTISDTVPFSPNGGVYITQYPDFTRNTNGGFCTDMLEDVMPDWMGIVLTLMAYADGAPTSTMKTPFKFSGDEVVWGGGTSAPALNSAIAAAAQTHGWTLVDGILDGSANLFSGHGYCAANSWIRRAEEAVIMQGPWVNWKDYLKTVPPVSAQTTGTLHPTEAGHWMIAQRIVAKLAPNLLPSPPADPPAPPTFTSFSNHSLLGANGWLTGHTADVTCPAGAGNCAFAQVEAHSASGTAIRGVSLLINGASPTCSETGVTTGGTTCQARLTDAETYSWSFAFANDGIYQLEFRVTTRNDAEGQFSRAVKVDLHDPVGTQTLSAPVPDSGWYTAPVSVMVTATDGSGSGIQSIQYALDDAPAEASGNSVSLVIDTDGSHSVGYQVVDFAGRTSTLSPLNINVDQIAPTSTAEPSPAANAAGWNSENVLLTLSTTDNGGSGIESFTYSATGAQSIDSTTVDGANPVKLSITTEGVTTISFAATDVAGNVEDAQTISVRLDKGAPVVTCATADEQWHASDVSLACTASDSGSGLAESSLASFSLSTSVDEGTESFDALTDGSQDVCDAVGNCVTAGPLGGNKVDKKGPTITIGAPASASYLLNESVVADYNCADGGSGLATCAGPVASGDPVDTASPGTKSFTVSATDNVGNTANHSVSYNVTYRVCVLFDQTKSHKLGSTVPIKLQLCDAGSSNMSAADIVLNATGLTKKDSNASGIVEDAGNSNPDSNFRFDAALAGYIFNLSTKGLSTGTWALSFTAANDPITYSVEFDVR